jgi:soluble lytic murein transglycosylase-like protein
LQANEFSKASFAPIRNASFSLQMLKMFKAERLEAATTARKAVNAGNTVAIFFPAAASDGIGIRIASAIEEPVWRNGNLVDRRIRGKLNCFTCDRFNALIFLSILFDAYL